MHGKVVLRGGFGEEFILTSWMDATPFQRACALEPHAAEHKFQHLLALNRHALELHRPNILSLSVLSSSLADRIDDAELRQMVFDRLARGGRLILVDEGLHLPCGVGFKPESIEGTAAPAPGSKWAGDSSKWTQEKKLESMHPELRPLVKAVIDGLAKRNFQPIIFFGWRSVAAQLEILKKHHTKVKFSFHNVTKKNGTPDAYAADIVDKRWFWQDEAAKNGYWKALGEEATKQNLYWGGVWKKRVHHKLVPAPDWAHVQLVPNNRLQHLKEESGL
jgi:hypothetical protein